jgi:3-oxoacyl-[acyl-carrier protein] reductase
VSGYDFSGKVAVVTGAGRGIGRAYAEAIGATGAAVVVADIDEAGAKETAEAVLAAGGAATAVRVDIADHDSVASLAGAATEQFGGIDYLVNNAAIFGGMKLDFLLTVDWAYLQRFLEVNLLGALVCTRACYQSMAARGGGVVVNQSSSAAYLYAGYYGWAKAGVNSLTQQLAHELGGMNIRVNAIAPGPTDTEAARSVVPDQYMRELVGSLALKRQGRPEDLVGMCLFLLSDDARWITGHIFSVDGGQVMRP